MLVNYIDSEGNQKVLFEASLYQSHQKFILDEYFTCNNYFDVLPEHAPEKIENILVTFDFDQDQLIVNLVDFNDLNEPILYESIVPSKGSFSLSSQVFPQNQSSQIEYAGEIKEAIFKNLSEVTRLEYV